MAKKSQLCDKQRKFCNYLLKGLSKKQAAIKAGYSATSAQTWASQMLATVPVQEYLQAHYRRESAEVEIERERIRKRLVDTIFADATRAFGDDWAPLEKKDIPRSVRRLILAVKVWESEEQGKSVSVKLLNQLDAIKTYLRFFPEAENKADDLAEAAEQVETTLEDLIKRLETK
jgi:hypothetical protein